MNPATSLPRFAAFAMAALFSLATVHAQDTNANAEKPLGAYHDKNRVLLLFAPNAQDPAYQEQAKLWQGDKSGFDERQLIIIAVLADAKKPVADPPGSLAKRFNVDPKAFAVVLVGKDGHDAFRSLKPVPTSTIYGLIDAMPMRRAEMKRQAAASPSPTVRPTPAKPDLDHDE